MNERIMNREKLESMLADWNAGFDKLEDRIRSVGADPGDDYNEVITTLRQHHYMRSQIRTNEKTAGLPPFP
ncbi:MAG: hypothetical protein V2I97_06975 [Desulfococcaceae bacterium]|nr:hypothetical protein [Desulfococcaceae bacterium]